MLLRVTDESPKVLRERISTPGGTTVAGLDELKRGHFRENLIAAVKAATRRAAEIGQSVVEKNLETEKK
jgi:pyrroline-5-carboxylate reductase